MSFFLITIDLFSQDNSFLIIKNIKIDYIKVEFYYANRRFSENDKILQEVLFARIDDTTTYVFKSFQNIVTNWKDEFFTIPSSKFDSFLEEVKKLDVEYINSLDNFNILDGSRYELTFGNRNYSIHANTNAADIDTERRGLSGYLELFRRLYDIQKE